MEPITAIQAIFIKLGEGGQWVSDCFRDNTIRLGYKRVPHDICLSACDSGDWAEARRAIRSAYGGGETATGNHLNQIRRYYESDSSVLWITFHGDCLWWCFSEQKITCHKSENIEVNGEKTRPVIGQWNNADINGNKLLKVNLSGRLLAVEGFMGTICSVRERQYLIHKINGTVEPHVAEVQRAFKNLQKTLIPIVKNLHPNDFEILVDLIFRQAGWQRMGVLGGTEKNIDLALTSLITDEKIAIQVKSQASVNVFEDYRNRFADMSGFARFYFVTHSPSDQLRQRARELTQNVNNRTFIFWDVQDIVSQAVCGGLTGWLLKKAS